MILLYTLKMLTDLSFYYAFAGFAAEYVGGGIRILWILVLCLDFGIAVKHWNVRGVRLLGIFLAFLPLLFGTAADRILNLPAVIYVAAELWKKDDSLSWYRQADLLSIFWKICLGFSIVFLIFGQYQKLVSATVPMAFMELSASFLLLRSLRHEEKIRRQREFQIRNFLTVGILAAAAWMLSNQEILQGCAAFLGAVYEYLIVPLFLAVSTAIGSVVAGILYGLCWLLQRAGLDHAALNSVMEGFQGQDQGAAPPVIESSGNQIGPTILMAVGAAVLIVVLVLFFRWLMRKQPIEKKAGVEKEDTVRFLEHPPGETKKKSRDARYVRLIRERYRKFLKLYRSSGQEPAPGETSGDIAGKWKEKSLSDTEEAVEKLTELYRKARYGGTASREDWEETDKVYRKIRKNV